MLMRRTGAAAGSALVCCVALALTGCSRGDSHAEQACKDADFYKHGVCMWGVGCTSAGSADIGNMAISEALASSTTSLHDAVDGVNGFDRQLNAVFEWCGTS
jgi:hypothetical protein